MTLNAEKLRIGFVPEHFSTPLHYGVKHFGLDAETTPFPTGTGSLTKALKEDRIDVAIGLTEGFTADLGKTIAAKDKPAYKLVGSYVESPLQWIIVSGKDKGLHDIASLRQKRAGVSRLGSGSYVMYYVLAHKHGWLDDGTSLPDPVVLGDFKALRDGVNGDAADFFMWEYFTTKKYIDSGELSVVGDIFTPWESWKIAARDPTDKRLEILAQKLNSGIAWFKEKPNESIDHITTAMEYSKEDAEKWMSGVRFPSNVRGVRVADIQKTVEELRIAGVLDAESDISAEDLASQIVGIVRDSKTS